MKPIDWKRVSERLRCPQCGEKAFIDAGSDGFEASHTHRFKLTREMAAKLSLRTREEIEADMNLLKEELAELDK